MKNIAIIIACFCAIGNSNCQRKKTVEIPIDKKGNFVSTYTIIKKYNEILGLPALEEGYDSLQLRIWCAYGNLKKTHLILITNNQGKWNGTLYKLLIDKAADTDTSFFLEKVEKRNVSPRSGWVQLIKNINELKITALPSHEYLPGYGVGVDVEFYMIEIATKNKYRFYDYLDPQAESKAFKEAAALEKFLKILEYEFSFQRYEIFE